MKDTKIFDTAEEARTLPLLDEEESMKFFRKANEMNLSEMEEVIQVFDLLATINKKVEDHTGFKCGDISLVYGQDREIEGDQRHQELRIERALAGVNHRIFAPMGSNPVQIPLTDVQTVHAPFSAGETVHVRFDANGWIGISSELEDDESKYGIREIFAGSILEDVTFVGERITPLGLEVVVAANFGGDVVHIIFNRDKVTFFRPIEMPEYTLSPSVSDGEDGLWICYALLGANMVQSRSEALRIIKAGGLQVGHEIVSDKNFHLQPGQTYVVRAGKRKWARITVEDSENGDTAPDEAPDGA